MRIAMLISRFYPLQGGAEVQCRLLAGELINSGIRSDIITQQLPHLSRRDNIEDLQIYRKGLPFKNKLGSFLYCVFTLLHIWKNRKIYNILHAHIASSPAVIAAIAGKLFSIPSVLRIAGSRSTGDIATSLKTWHGRYKLKFLKQNIGTFICLSNEMKQELLNNGFPENKITIIANGVDITRFSPASQDEKKLLRKKLELDEDRLIINYTGRLESGKGIELLIKSWRSLIERYPDNKYLLLIAGSGSLESALKHNSRDIGSIHYAGWKANTHEYLRSSDIFVLPSYGEGMPNALIEAMACGLACIATDIGGINEIITHQKNGYLITPGNASELTAGFEKLINDQSFADSLGRRARAYVEENLSIKHIARQYVQLYNKITTEN